MINPGLAVLVFFIVGVVFGIINNEVRSSVFWFWIALLTAVVLTRMQI